MAKPNEQKMTQPLTPDSQLFYEAFKASPIGIAVENLDGQPLFVNSALCSMLGFSEEVMHSKRCVDLSLPEDAERDWALFQQLREGSIDHYQIEKRLLRHDGSLIWGRLSISLLKGHQLVVAMVEDITDRRRTEEALHASEERLRLAQLAARIGTFEWNIQSGVSVWTPELQALYGLPPGGHDGTHANFQKLVHPDDRARMAELTDRALKTGKPVDGEFRIVWPDGSVRWINGRAQVIFDDSGQSSRMLGVNVDITEHKMAEERLREYERAVESTEEMIAVVDREYRYRIANNQYLKMQNMASDLPPGN